MKIIGFSPGQVAAAYAGQGLVPAAAGCMVGVLVGNLPVRPLLAGAAYSFGPGVLGVPAWVDVDVVVVMFGLTALAALALARRLTRVP
ncbi:MAG: FtsX-like permease family protein [Streptosporangiaceae bacterium]